MSADNGGPAFPAPEAAIALFGASEADRFAGMTMRDYFAAKAMQGMVAGGCSVDIDGDHPFQARASTAYMVADAMLKERNK